MAPMRAQSKTAVASADRFFEKEGSRSLLFLGIVSPMIFCGVTLLPPILPLCIWHQLGLTSVYFLHPGKTEIFGLATDA